MNEFVTFLLSLLAIYVALMLTGIHTIREGHVGVYYDRGVLSSKLAGPGIHFAMPFLKSHEEIQISVQTDLVKNVPCGTSGGTLVYFDKIQVVNRLKKKYVYETVKNYTREYDKIWIFNKIHHQINQFCSKHTLTEIYIDLFATLDQELIQRLQVDLEKWAPGIQILSVRVTKPRIPDSIKENYEQMEQMKVKYMIISEKQKTLIEQQNTKHKRAMIQAESLLEVRLIELEKQIKLRKNQLKLAKIDAEIQLDKAKAEVDAQFLSAMKELELQTQYLSRPFLKYTGVLSFTENTTIVLGDRIPNVVSSLKI